KELALGDVHLAARLASTGIRGTVREGARPIVPVEQPQRIFYFRRHCCGGHDLHSLAENTPLWKIFHLGYYDPCHFLHPCSMGDPVHDANFFTGSATVSSDRALLFGLDL